MYLKWTQYLIVGLLLLGLGTTASAQVDASIDSVSVGSYTRVPVTQIAPVPLAAKLNNVGTASFTGATVTAEVFEVGNPTAIFTTTSAATGAIAPGTSTVVTMGTWTPTAANISQYSITYTSTVTNDANAGNNSFTGNLEVTARTYARDDGIMSGGLGTATGNIRQGLIFEMVNAEDLYEVEASINGGAVGDSLIMEVYSTNVSGTPTTLLASSTPIVLTAPSPGTTIFNFPTPINLLPGTYVVSLYQSTSTANISLGYSDNIFAPGEAWIRVGTGAWTNPENFGFNAAYMIRPRFTPLANDVGITRVTTPHPEYTIIPETQYAGTALTAEVEVENFGAAAATGVVVTTEIFSAGNLSTPLTTLTSTAIPTLAVGATATVTVGTYTPPAGADTYIFEHTVSTTSPDQDPANDSESTSFTVSTGTYARDDGQSSGSLGIGANATPGVYDNAILGQNFELINNGRIDSITARFSSPTAGDSVRIAVYATNATTGTPTFQVAFTDSYIFTAADAAAGVLLTLPITNGPVSLTAGTYYVGVREYNENVTLSTTPVIFTTGTTWLRWNGNPNGTTAWSNNENFNFNVTYVLRPNLLPSCDNFVSTTTTTDATCSSADGSADVSISGGVAPYTYLWSTGATTNNINNVIADSYVVTVTGSTGCTSVDTLVVGATASPISLSSSSTDASCGVNDGSVSVTASNGNMPYSYLWSNGSTTASVTGLGSGTYNVTVVDDDGCDATASETVSVPSGPSATAALTPVGCFGGNDGVINATVTGGTTPYSYLWSNGATTEDISGLTAGTYSGTITDDNGCTFAVSNLVVSEPALLTLSASGTDVTCNGDGDGAVSLTVAGGTPLYSYSWSNGATTQNLTGLSGGVYSATVTDENSCTANSSVTVSEPSAISVTASSNDVTCNGDGDGSIDLAVTGGTTPYSYNWNNGAVTEDLNNLSGGIYSGTISDDNGCTVSASVTITEPNELLLSAAVSNVSCNGNDDGAIDVTATGGTMPYSFSWSTGATTEDLSGLSPNTYIGLLTDDNSCTVSATITVTEPAVLTASTTVTDVAFNGGSDGAVDLTPSGGTAPYSYSWDNGETTEDLSNVAAGSYSVTITDDNGCTFTTTVSVSEPPVSTSTVDLPYGLQIFPNPTKGLVNLDFELNQTTEVSIRVFSATGQLLRDVQGANIQSEQLQLDMSEYPSGVYFLQINAGGHISGHRVILQD